MTAQIANEDSKQSQANSHEKRNNIKDFITYRNENQMIPSFRYVN